MRIRLYPLYFVLVLVFLWGCRATAPTSGQNKPPLLKNYTPLPVHLLYTLDDRDAPFYTLVMKATFRITEDFRLIPKTEQKSVFQSDQKGEGECQTVMSEPRDYVAFKPKADIYVTGPLVNQQLLVREPSIRFGEHFSKIPTQGACFQMTFNQPALRISYPQGFEAIRMENVFKEGPVILKPPQHFVPWVLVRYLAGQMIPIPTRLDTVVIRPKDREVTYTFRTTVSQEVPIRKFDVRLVTQQSLDKNQVYPDAQETPQARIRRSHATLDYLNRCQVPQTLGEPCADPKRIPDAAIFGK